MSTTPRSRVRREETVGQLGSTNDRRGVGLRDWGLEKERESGVYENSRPRPSIRIPEFLVLINLSVDTSQVGNDRRTGTRL